MALAGLDVGSSGCKCTIVREDGVFVTSKYCEYDISRKVGEDEIDPDTVWESICYVIKEAALEASKSGDKVQALAMSSFAEAAVPIDKDGNVLAPAMMYTDPRGGAECAELVQKLGSERIFEITGLAPHSMYTVSKIMWLRNNKPEIYEKIYKILCFEDFVCYRLTGKAVAEPTLAARTLLCDVADDSLSKKWSADMLEAAGLNEDMFGELKAPGSAVGTVLPEMAKSLCLAEDTMIVIGAHDQICAAIGAGVLQPGPAVNGTGTVECVTPVFDKPIKDENMKNNNFNCAPHAVDGRYVTYAFSYAGGALLKWFRKTFAKDLEDKAKETGKNIYTLLDELVKDSEPTNLLVLPHFSGAATPYMDAEAKGAIVGLTLDTDRATIYRALMEGVAYEMLLNIDLLESVGVKVDSLVSAGGGSNSKVWLQIKADITGRPISSLEQSEAGTIGAVILAGVAVGVYDSIESAVEKLVHQKKTYYPNPENHAVYMKQYEKYKKMYAAVKEFR